MGSVVQPNSLVLGSLVSIPIQANPMVFSNSYLLSMACSLKILSDLKSHSCSFGENNLHCIFLLYQHGHSGYN